MSEQSVESLDRKLCEAVRRRDGDTMETLLAEGATANAIYGSDSVLYWV